MMSVFEFVMMLTSVISGLALAHLLTGVVALLRNVKRVKFSLAHALWMWTAFAITIGNWASDWELRALTEWPAWTLLLIIVSKVAQYVVCVFVTPDVPANGEIDLKAFHEREGNNYLWALVALCFVALGFNFAFGGATFYGPWLRDSMITVVAGAITLLAILVKARWVQIGAAASSAGLATYFLVVVSALGAA